MNFGGSASISTEFAAESTIGWCQFVSLSTSRPDWPPSYVHRAAAAAAAAQLNLPSQLLASGIQAMGVMGSLNLSQLRPNGALAYAQQRMGAGSMRQQMVQQNSLTLSGSKPTKNTITGIYEPSECTANYDAELSVAATVVEANANYVCYPSWYSSSPKSDQQLQQQPQIGHQQLQQQQQQQQLLQQQQQQLLQQQQQQQQQSQQQLQQVSLHQQQQHQQQSPRMPGPPGQKTLSLTGSQPDATASGNNYTRGEFKPRNRKQLINFSGREKIQDLVSQVDSRGKLDPEVEELFLEIADDFIDSVTAFACSLAKHRKSSTLESKDILLHLEKNWHLTIPGFSSEERKHQSKPSCHFLHTHTHAYSCLVIPTRSVLDMIRALMESSQSEENNVNPKEMIRQGHGNPAVTNHLIRPSPSSEQLVSQSTGSPIVQQITRF
ncbi:hypothetical protein NC652_007798 [Populus alba x Populus x berolinensis]|nr:hypothetical protein NC652_007798 [Populus alba x Populus x berolinensis]